MTVKPDQDAPESGSVKPQLGGEQAIWRRVAAGDFTCGDLAKIGEAHGLSHSWRTASDIIRRLSSQGSIVFSGGGSRVGRWWLREQLTPQPPVQQVERASPQDEHND